MVTSERERAVWGVPYSTFYFISRLLAKEVLEASFFFANQVPPLFSHIAVYTTIPFRFFLFFVFLTKQQQREISSIRDMGVLGDPEALLLVLPAIVGGVVMYMCLRRFPSPATLPLLMAGFLGVFFGFLWITGATLEVQTAVHIPRGLWGFGTVLKACFCRQADKQRAQVRLPPKR